LTVPTSSSNKTVDLIVSAFRVLKFINSLI
jgi:hypothetical protein